MQDDNHLNFIKEEYPILWKQALILTDQFKKNNKLTLDRLVTDFKELKRINLISEKAVELIKVQLNLGDAHRKGQSVIFFEFNDNELIVYKPRDLQLESQFSKYITYINKFLSHKLETPHILNKHDYGWVEYIQNKDSETESDVKGFYYKLGIFTCIFYLLRGSDFHYENLIVNNGDPYFIDIESIISPDVNVSKEKQRININDSIFSLAILPHRLKSEFEEGTTMSAMCNIENELQLSKTYKIDKSADEYRIIEEKGYLKAGKNVPKLNGKAVNYKLYLEEYTEGFKEFYQLLLNNKLSQIDLIAQIFKNVKVRVIFRNTYKYFNLIGDCFHPKFLVDAVKRDLHLFQLWETVFSDRKYGCIIRSEINDINRLDVPYFYTKSDSVAVYNSFGIKLNEYFFSSSGLDLVKSKLMSISLDDLERQLFYIKIATLGYDVKETHRLMKTNGTLLPSIATKLLDAEQVTLNNRISKIITSIADRLIQLKIETEVQCEWIDFVLKDNHVQIGVFDLSIYSGIFGNIYFLAWTGKLYDLTYSKIAEKALKSIIPIVINNIDEIKLSTGLYYGWSGVLSYCIQLERLFQNKDLFDMNTKILDRLLILVKTDQNNDVMYGNAGLIVGLYPHRNEKKYKDKIYYLINVAGLQLLENINSLGSDINWTIDSLRSKNQPYGYAHGNSGISLALFIAWKVTNNESFYEVMIKSLRAERLRLNLIDKKGNLISKFKGLKNSSYITGSTGICISRISLIKLGYSDKIIEKEIKLLMNNSKCFGFSGNHSIATGSLSDYEMVYLYHELNPKREDDNELKNYLNMIISEIEKDGPKSNNLIHLENLNFFNGLSGIGYQLLRSQFPNKVPSILEVN